ASSIMATAFHGHNQLVQLLVTGGVAFAVLVGLLLVMASRSAVRQAGAGSLFGALYVVALAGTCLLEVSVVMVDNMSMLPVVLVPLAALSCADRKDLVGDPDDAPRESAGRYPAADMPRRSEP